VLEYQDELDKEKQGVAERIKQLEAVDCIDQILLHYFIESLIGHVSFTPQSLFYIISRIFITFKKVYNLLRIVLLY
jgi:hypothetical protein